MAVTRKQTNNKIDKEFLATRAEISIKRGYSKQKWISFCEFLIDKGFDIYLYEARKTKSKYVTIVKDNKKFKVRFSNHKPIKHKEENGDCDFFVGRTNKHIATTRDAYIAAMKFFNPPKEQFNNDLKNQLEAIQ